MQEGEPVWVWTYTSGWKEYVSVEAVAVESTHEKDRDSHLTQAERKVEQVYQHLSLPPMDSYKLRCKVTSWMALIRCSLAAPIGSSSSSVLPTSKMP